MSESRSDGKAHNGTSSVDAPDAGAKVSTHESAPGDAASPDGDLDILARGSTVGRYLVLERLGAGAMGVVYAAYDPKLDRKIALKLLRPQEGRGDQARRTARLEREAQATAKLSHPNVVGIFDVGVHDGQVFMAMEYLAGGTLRDWLKAKKRPWREIVKMFIEVGHGLGAAHAEGLTHRDFKPDNVLLDKAGKPKVVDFGLVRLTSSTDLTASGSIDSDANADEQALLTHAADQMAAVLTRTGALAGTPAYMAPEQFLGKQVDARTDQFAFCVALFEALHGERPFVGNTVIGLADSVTSGRLRETKDSSVPAWLRKVPLRGLQVDPMLRHESIESLLVRLAHPPGARLKRRTAVVIASLAILSGIIAIQRRAERQRIEFQRQVASLVADGDRKLSSGLALKTQAFEMRMRAFDAFDNSHRDEGENLWAKYLQSSAVMDEAWQAAASAFGSALDLDKDRSDIRQNLTRALTERAELADVEARSDDLQLIRKQIASINPSMPPPWTVPATFVLDAQPAATSLVLEQFISDIQGRLRPTPVPHSGRALTLPITIQPGSYRLAIHTDEGRDVYVPFQAMPASVNRMSVSLPRSATIPAGFSLVTGGDFWFGDANEDWRMSFLNTVPIHKRQCHSFIIGTTEVQVSDWLRFLDDLPSTERKRRTPAASNVHGGMRIEQSGPGPKWRYVLSVGGKTHYFEENRPLVYSGRSGSGRELDWKKLPVTGVSAEDVSAYLEWFKRQLPTARLCSELEWERAARGADARNYPASLKKLLPTDANIDATYGRIATAFGPDEVGSHSASTSPFGLHDMAGNVWEMATSVLSPRELVLRGGSYYHGSIAAAATNREPIELTTRSPVMGFRVCGDVPTRI